MIIEINKWYVDFILQSQLTSEELAEIHSWEKRNVVDHFSTRFSPLYSKRQACYEKVALEQLQKKVDSETFIAVCRKEVKEWRCADKPRTESRFSGTDLCSYDWTYQTVHAQGFYTTGNLLDYIKATISKMDKETKNKAFRAAAASNFVEALKLLLEDDDIDLYARDENTGCTAFMLAIQNRANDTFKELFAKKVNYSLRDKAGNTAFMLAASFANFTAAKALLEEDKEEKVNINDINNAGKTALMLVITAIKDNYPFTWGDRWRSPTQEDEAKSKIKSEAEQDQLKIMETLREIKDLNPNIKDNEHDTALLIASHLAKDSIFKLLLTFQGIDLNAQDKSGETVLIKTCRWQEIDRMNWLLSMNGIDVNVRDKLGETALMKAGRERTLQSDWKWEPNYTESSMLKNGWIKFEKAAQEARLKEGASLKEKTLKVLRILLKVPGINIRMKNNAGLSVYDLVKNREAKYLIKQHCPALSREWCSYFKAPVAIGVISVCGVVTAAATAYVKRN